MALQVDAKLFKKKFKVWQKINASFIRFKRWTLGK